MDTKDVVLMDNSSFQILKCESQSIFNPSVFGISPIWESDSNFEYSCIYDVKDYQLFLKSLTISSDRGLPEINGIKPDFVSSNKDSETYQYENIMEPLKFTGAMVIGNSLVKEYGDTEEAPCYGYKQVRELNFHDGKLVISIDHSRAMLRIRKNIDMGLRKLNNKKDEKCIQSFLKTSFIGDYDHPFKKRKAGNKKKISIKTYIQKLKNYGLKITT